MNPDPECPPVFPTLRSRGKRAMGDTDRRKGDLPPSETQSWTFLFFRPVKKMTTVSQSSRQRSKDIGKMGKEF